MRVIPDVSNNKNTRLIKTKLSHGEKVLFIFFETSSIKAFDREDNQRCVVADQFEFENHVFAARSSF